MTPRKRAIGKWALLLALLCYAVGMGLWARATVRARMCTGVEVQFMDHTNVPLSKQAVQSELGRIATHYCSMPLYALDTRLLEERLGQINNFEHVEVVRTAGGTLKLQVWPMVPEARIFTPTDSYYINAGGKRLDAEARYFADLPVVRGNFTDRMPATGALPVVRALRSDSLLRSLVSMIDYRDPHNILLVPRIHGHVVNLGDTTALDDKFDRLLLMYRKVMPHAGWNKYDTISLKYRGQIVATRADKKALHHGPEEDPDQTDWEEAALQAQTIDTEPTASPQP